MKVAIAGGTGLVGRALTSSLAGDGHEVVVLSRRTGRHRRPLPAGARIADWSSDDVAGLASVIDGSDAVVDVAGAPVGPWRWTRRRKATLFGSRVKGARAIVAAIEQLPRERRPSTLVVVSGVDAYPETIGPDPTPMTESTPIGAGFLATVTRALEDEALRAESFGVRVVRLRMGHVLARDADLVRLLALPVRLFVGGRIGSGQQWVSWNHIDDVVGLFRKAIVDERVRGVLNLTAPNPVRQIDLVRSMARVLRRPARIPVPGWVVRLALGEEASLLLGSRRVSSARAVELGYVFEFVSIDAAIEDVLG